MTMEEEGRQVAGILTGQVPRDWDGKRCILEMREAGSGDWKQMEWIGFYFEFKARQVLIPKIGGDIGPVYGRTKFDYKLNYVWDFKVHPQQPGKWAYMNDTEAVDSCIQDHGGIGWLIACGRSAYDDFGEFKAWHDRLKGEKSKYEQENLKRGAAQRTRKTSFLFNDLVVVRLESQDAVKDAMAAGWLRDNMQAGQRNSNGKPRRPKYGVDIAGYLASGGLNYPLKNE